MNYIDIINSSYFKETYAKIEELKKDFPVNHGFIHINNVIENAKRVAKIFNLDKHQKELLLIASSLHDIGYLLGKDDHAYNGSILAKDILKKWNFNDDDIEIISAAIKNHGGKNNEEYKDIISICLIISDKLDFIHTRYDKNRIKEEHKNIFPYIFDTYIEYINDNIILNIITSDKFDITSFKNSHYYNKLTNFLNLLSNNLKTIYKISYIKK